MELSGNTEFNRTHKQKRIKLIFMSPDVIECMTAEQIVLITRAIKYYSPALDHIIAESLQKLNDPNPLSARHCFQRLCAFSARPLFTFPSSTPALNTSLTLPQTNTLQACAFSPQISFFFFFTSNVILDQVMGVEGRAGERLSLVSFFLPSALTHTPSTADQISASFSPSSSRPFVRGYFSPANNPAYFPFK